MHSTAVHGSPSGHQRLRGDLSTENALAIFGRLGPSENVDFNVFEVEEMVDEERQSFGHDLQARSSHQSGVLWSRFCRYERTFDISRQLSLGYRNRGASDRGQQYELGLVASRTDIGTGRGAVGRCHGLVASL